MMLPLLAYEDGYGMAYGVQLGRPDVAGTRSRLSMPLSWGGDKRAAASLDKHLDRGPLTRLELGGSVGRRTNPYYDEHDDRQRAWVRGERRLTTAIVAGVSGAWQHASFLSDRDHVIDAGADLAFDTRLDPLLPRNAVYARAGWTRSSIQHDGPVHRIELEGQGHVGLVGQTVLAVRALRTDANRPLPPYLQPMLGGTGSVRGFKVGSAIGDTLVAGSAELRVPLTSAFRVEKLGVSAFFDAGAVYNEGERLADQSIARGAGGSVWMSARFVRFNLAVAHGLGGTTRVHVGAVFGF
jgi:outer membrane protein assembly factor BamA